MVVDEFSRECLAILVARRLNSDDVLALLTERFVIHGPPDHIRPLSLMAAQSTAGQGDNGPEFCAHAVRDWLGRLDVSTLFIEPGSPWENGYCEPCNGKLRDELLTMEIFHRLKEAAILIETWRRHYNAHRPHSSLGYRPPAPKTANHRLH